MLKETVQRLSAESPDYQKKLVKICAAAVVVSGLIIGAPAVGISLGLPAGIVTAAKVIAYLGAGLGFGAQTAKKDPPAEQQGN